jgi:Na+/H+ antiporter NhaD/arsenite permease-like protein
MMTALADAAVPGPAAALPAWSVLPFAALLLAIAVLPLVHRTAHWWESNRSKFIVSMACGLAALAAIAATHGAGAAGAAVGHAAAEFVPFIVLLFSLYVISGGILISGDLRGTPLLNTSLLATGALAANLLGTTGASMLLIRPLLRANAGRRHRAHVVVFFIFLVSNVGGLLLPIGDPPLFLGYLRGVPFDWTLGLFREWPRSRCRRGSRSRSRRSGSPARRTSPGSPAWCSRRRSSCPASRWPGGPCPTARARAR